MGMSTNVTVTPQTGYVIMGLSNVCIVLLRLMQGTQ